MDRSLLLLSPSRLKRNNYCAAMTLSNDILSEDTVLIITYLGAAVIWKLMI